MNGVLPLWKPKGLTSHDCVQKVRKIFNIQRVGHTGTLDPEVEGVLVLCLGEATKLVQFLTTVKKTYIAECTLGVATETEDQTGKIIEKVSVDSFPSLDQIKNVLKSFKGEIIQIPPMYSAVRVRGKRLYEYARKNEAVERPKRKVFIHDIFLQEVNKQKQAFVFQTTCSSGTYIRTLCVDIGEKLGFPAHMSHLVRTETSNFSKEEAITFSNLYEAKENNQLGNLLFSKKRALRHLDEIQVDERLMKKISHGQKLHKPKESIHTDPFKMMYKNEVIALYTFDEKNKNILRPKRVFQFTNK